MDFVQVVFPEPVIKQRLDAPSRCGYRKLNSPARYRERRVQGSFSFPDLPPAEIARPIGLARTIRSAT